MNAREHLIDLLIGSPADARDNNWPAIFDLATTWSVIPNLRQRLADLGIALPPDLKRRLFGLFQEAFAASSLEARRGVAVCRKLEDHGLPAAVFKGLASIAHLYHANPSARTIKDVDILIREEHLDAALTVMQELGLKADYGGDLSRYTAFVRNSPGFSGNEAISVGGDGTGEMDVHWSLGPRTAPEFRAEAIIERSTWVTLFETPVRVIAPIDGLLLSAHHAVRENFAPDGMLRDVLDTQLWLRLLVERGELETALVHARRCRIEDPVMALADILRHPAASPSPAASALSKVFWLQVQKGPLGKDLTYLADPHSLQQILRGALSGWTEYTSYMQAIETKLTGKPVSLSGRVAYLARRLPDGYHGWKMIRALAKAKAAYQRSA